MPGGLPERRSRVAEHLANTQVESISWLIHGGHQL